MLRPALLLFFLWATLSPPMAKGDVPVVWNILDHGAIEGHQGDSSWKNRHRIARINTRVIQHGLDTQHKHKLPVYIPGGFWYVQSITTPYRSGGMLMGCGVQETTSGDWGHRSLGGTSTRLIYVDDPGESEEPSWLLKVTGTHFQIKGGLLFCGQSEMPDPHEKRCDIGLFITKDGHNGLGTGKLIADHLHFRNFDKGVQNGAAAHETNCETNSYRGLSFEKCRIGIELRNSQGMGHYIGSLGAGDPKTEAAIDVYGGGMVTVDHGIASCLILRLNGNTPGRFTTGPANGTFVINNLKVDAGASKPGMFQLVKMTSPMQVDIVTSGGRISGDSFGAGGGIFAELRGNAALTVRDWVGNLEGAIRCEVQSARDGTVYKPNVLLDRCRLWGNAQKILQGDAYFVLRDCYGWSGGVVEAAAEKAASEKE
jgi:hypothetical protein